MSCLPVDEHRARWLELGVPAAEIERVAEYQSTWGGLVLPPAPCYDGGPRVLGADVPEEAPDGGWWFEAGLERSSLPYGFVIGPAGEFGISGDRWTPLHASVEGWVESLALAAEASLRARTITRLKGPDVDDLSLEGFEPVPEVAGLADTWWRSPDSAVAIYKGEAECFSSPTTHIALVYDGLPEWALD